MELDKKNVLTFKIHTSEIYFEKNFWGNSGQANSQRKIKLKRDLN